MVLLKKTTDYIGNFVYEDKELKYILTNEGRVMANSNSSFEYQYFLKDLPITIGMGNTRVTFNQNRVVIQEDSYYLFDMAILPV